MILILIAIIPLFLSYNITIIHKEEWLLSILPFTSLSLIAIGPLLYEYAFQFFNADRKKLFEEKKKYIPFIASSALLIIGKILFSDNVYTYILLVTIGLSLIHLIFYIVKLIRYQVKSTKKLKHFYSSLSDKNLFWINILILGLFIAVLLDSVSGVIIASTGFQEIVIINTAFLLILIWYLGYYSLIQEKIAYNIHEHNIPFRTEADNSCNTEEFQELESKLNIAMQENKLYKQEKINLSILSEHLNVSIKKTSYLLNQCMNTTFYDLINEFRLEEFKSKVKKGELNEKTILALALESGFNSKATFNRVFKLKEKVSPIQYVKNENKGLK